MSINFEKALGVDYASLQLRLYRAQLITSNIINVNTPGFQAKDIDFRSEMKLSKQDKAYLNSFSFPHVKYRNSPKLSLDGNNVALEVEQSELTKNAMNYQTGLLFLNMKLTGIKKAIEGK